MRKMKPLQKMRRVTTTLKFSLTWTRMRRRAMKGALTMKRAMRQMRTAKKAVTTRKAWAIFWGKATPTRRVTIFFACEEHISGDK